MNNRLTLILTTGPERQAWPRGGVLRVDSLKRLRRAISTQDVERVILDRSASSDVFLRFLSALPREIAGDVMVVREDGGAFLSSVGRGGDRVLYALAAGDVHFYLQTHGLIEECGVLARSA